MFTANSFADTGFVKFIPGFMYPVNGLDVIGRVNINLRLKINKKNPALEKKKT